MDQSQKRKMRARATELRETGMSYNQIASKMNDEGYVNSLGNKMNYATVQYFLGRKRQVVKKTKKRRTRKTKVAQLGSKKDVSLTTDQKIFILDSLYSAKNNTDFIQAILKK